MNHNAHKISFWVFAHIIDHAKLFRDIRLGAAKAYSSDGSIDVEVLFSDCLQPDAVWHEVLRLYNNAAVARKVAVDTTIHGKVHPSETLLGPFRQFYTDPDIFGSDAFNFDSPDFSIAETSTAPKATIHLAVGTRIGPVDFLRDLRYTFLSQPH